MKAIEWQLAQKFQQQIERKQLLYCPLCDEFTVNPKERQPLCAVGDSENLLFCPHCDLTVHLLVDADGYSGKVYGERHEKEKNFN